MKETSGEIRRAGREDVPALARLLYQVHRVHSDLRPDLFEAGSRKYTDEQLLALLDDADRPIFVYERAGVVLGYAFCIHRRIPGGDGLRPVHTLYLDDLCVDAEMRGEHVGSALYQHVVAYARACGCHDLTLNVWEGNRGALAFYRRMGMQVQKTVMETLL